MENNLITKEKTDLESLIKTILYFSSIKEGFFDYSISIKSNLSNFNIGKQTALSKPLFEYLCYKNIKKLISDGKNINKDILITTDNFLLNKNCKEIFLKTNANRKKNMIICIQNIQTLKWSLIAFLNLDEQIKNYLDINNKNPIKAKILSSNLNSDEDDFILNDTMDRLETSFDFKSRDDIQFEVDSLR